MLDVGRLCVKIAGRDAGATCVVVDVLDDNFVLIDGGTRRRKCNAKHLEPLDKVIKIKKNASHEKVAEAFKNLKLPVWEKKAKKAGEKPRAQRTGKKEEKKVKRAKEAKKPAMKSPDEDKTIKSTEKTGKGGVSDAPMTKPAKEEKQQPQKTKEKDEGSA